MQKAQLVGLTAIRYLLLVNIRVPQRALGKEMKKKRATHPVPMMIVCGESERIYTFYCSNFET